MFYVNFRDRIIDILYLENDLANASRQIWQKNKNNSYAMDIIDFKHYRTTTIPSDQQCCMHIYDRSLDDFNAVLCI